MAFDIDPETVAAAKIAGGGLAGGLLLLGVNPAKDMAGALWSLSTSLAAAYLAAPPTQAMLMASGFLGWQNDWITVVAGVWAIIGLEMARRGWLWAKRFDMAALILRITGKGQ